MRFSNKKSIVLIAITATVALTIGSAAPAEMPHMQRPVQGQSPTSVKPLIKDQNAPKIMEFVINHGADKTSSKKVNLHFRADQSVTQFRASEGPNFPGNDGMWRAAGGTEFILSDGNGTKTVYLQVKSDRGFSQTVQDSIILEIPPPQVTSFKINNGAEIVNRKVVTLNNVTAFGPTHYRAAEFPNLIVATWQPYAGAPSFTLSDVMGKKTVYFQTKNAQGESAVTSDSVILSPCQKCFGAVGSQCGWGRSGSLPLSTCVGNECFVNAGSWQHDECCFKNPDGYMCDPAGTNKCKAEFDLAAARTTANLSWKRRVDVNKNNCSGTVVFADYCAPTGTILTGEDGRYCCRGHRSIDCNNTVEVALLTSKGHNPLRCNQFIMCK